MKKILNILIFPAGMENGLEIQKALQYCKEVRLFAASSIGINQAFYTYRAVNIVRDVRQQGWIEDLNSIIQNNAIDLVFPANSLVIDHLSSAREKIAAPVLLPDDAIIRLTRSKKQTINALQGVIPVPEIYHCMEQIPSYPVFAKPDKGYGAQGAMMIESSSHAHSIDFESCIVQEYLPGKEYTVDCFSDSEGNLLFSGARERSRVRMATSMHAERVDAKLEAELRGYANDILKKIKITGAWFFQVKEDVHGKLKLLEIDVRIAGTMCFNRARGINFPLLSIHQFMGSKVSVLFNDVPISLDRCLKNRYVLDYAYDSVYVDLDDTIIVHDRLNAEIIQFLYQCVHNRKKVVLITKHLGPDVVAHLKKWRISELFDDILWIKEDQSKADLIPREKAIYIDDSFSQRLEVHEKCCIPTFDPSMVEALIDERI